MRWDQISIRWDGMGPAWYETGMGWDKSQAAYIRKITRIGNKGPGFPVLFIPRDWDGTTFSWDRDGIGPVFHGLDRTGSGRELPLMRWDQEVMGWDRTGLG